MTDAPKPIGGNGNGPKSAYFLSHADQAIERRTLAVLVDNEPGFLNRVSSEYAARQAFGLQQAFRRCQKKDDWHRPKNAPASWRSKVDWEEHDRLDPRASETLPWRTR